MHTKILVGGALLVAALSGVSCEEDAAVAATTSSTIAGFMTTNDATEYAKITLDIKDIETEMKRDNKVGYPEALKIYNEGKNSMKSGTTKRTLAGMELKTDEPFGKLYDMYSKIVITGTHVGYTPHTSAVAALTGADDAYGKYASGSISNKGDFRSYIAKKTIKFQILQLYALHELEAAFAKYKEGKDATLALDEWWAFYAGAGEDGTAKTGGAGPYIQAEKSSAFFGTNGQTVGNGGVSSVNQILLAGTKKIKTLMLKTGNDTEIENIIKCMRAQLKVPLIQGCIQYAYKTDTDTPFPGENSPARKGGTWAFCSAVLPFLHEVSATDAAILRAETDVVPRNDKNPSWSKIKGVFTAANLNKMGVSCLDVGGFVPGEATSPGTLGADFVTCTDGTISNTDADSTKCSGLKTVTADANRHLTASVLSMAASFILSAALLTA